MPEEHSLSAQDSLRLLALLSAPDGETLNLPAGLKALVTPRYVHLVRMALEGIAIDRVAQSHTEEDLARLNAVVSELQTAARQRPPVDTNRIAELMFTFQHLVSVLSHNSIFPLVMNAFRTFHLSFWKAEADQLGAEHCLLYAQTLLDCIVRRDSAAAKARMC